MNPLRLDVITIFPDYLRVLDLSLIGRAAAEGLIDLEVHDLRDWTHDRHRTVDDTPLGGGPGMVMRPDVWGRALDEVLGRAEDGRAVAAPGRRRRQVLVVPTPAGEVFTQRTAEDLAGADHIVLACGRYEGIDARVAEHYGRAGFEVRELSIGDYVLNGGEAAALVIIEAVARLIPGVLGNPGSVVEESHSRAGLLEHPVYTRPVSWRGLGPEPVLLGGDHGRVARTRRDQALRRTARRRPDMIERLDPQDLDPADRAVLAGLGWAVPQEADHPVPLRLREATEADLPALAELAARTFPDACPPAMSRADIAEHVRTRLSQASFAQWVADPRAVLVVAELAPGAGEPPGLVGYSLVLLEPSDGAGPPGLDPRPPGLVAPPGPTGGDGLSAELSKAYVDASLRGSGVAGALLERAVRDAAERGVTLLWLGTHERNRRAQKAYRRTGFARSGSRTYQVGFARCDDVVMSVNPQERGEHHGRRMSEGGTHR
ncbi:MAG: tRNA (guanosine(37)-N1)-methyltransferase TrmD [Actinomyces sp.]|uniref:tRNA (guanosine(37)-N1)-methyltransferase TrmD n=1 Tax=Actinomyces sp. TaxID=29317 RepID=UPI0026DCE01C|nr:tRNA (guanosine(37)-N1)-methyltransferase TrmD [Actinomyces sp.]MDO4243945.1 tRNA (guanosine(37)-N1)-methyltransferase TrmD [Actinomyces sp.]